jgi:hypothetical protein
MTENTSSDPAPISGQSFGINQDSLKIIARVQPASWVFYASSLWMLLGISIQLAAGASLVPAFIIYSGTLLGCLGAFALRKQSTALMIITIWFTLKTTGVALLCKSLAFEPWDSQVGYPFSTAIVYFLGYAGLFTAAVFLNNFSWKSSKPVAISAFQWRTAAIIFFLAASLQPFFKDDKTGGLWGALKFYSALGDAACVTCAVSASIIANPKRIWFHPIALCLLAALMILAVINTGKEAFVSPIVGYVMPLLITKRVGIAKIALLGIIIICLITFIIGPYSDTIRFTGVRELSGQSRITATMAGIKSMFDPEVRADAKAQTEAFRTKAGAVQMMNGDWAYFDRLMTISGGKELISAVNADGVLGMRLLWGDLSLLLPRMIAPWKSDVDSNYELARYSGMVPDSIQENVGISFGPFPTFYAMGGYWGLFLLSTCLIGLFFLLIKGIENHYRGKLIGGLIFLLVWHSFPEEGSPVEEFHKLLFLVITLWLCKTIEILKTPVR